LSSPFFVFSSFTAAIYTVSQRLFPFQRVLTFATLCNGFSRNLLAGQTNL